MQFIFEAQDESATDRLGAALAAVLPAGAVVALIGTLGAGKTRLVQAVCNAAGIEPREVLSPTFVLVHEYRVRVQRSAFSVQRSETPGHQTPGHQAPVLVIYHLDAYRIRDDDEFRELGPEEYFESDGWTFIEWADRVANCLPAEYLRIVIEVIGATTRHFTVSAHGERLAATIQALRNAVQVP